MLGRDGVSQETSRSLFPSVIVRTPLLSLCVLLAFFPCYFALKGGHHGTHGRAGCERSTGCKEQAGRAPVKRAGVGPHRLAVDARAEPILIRPGPEPFVVATAVQGLAITAPARGFRGAAPLVRPVLWGPTSGR